MVNWEYTTVESGQLLPSFPDLDGVYVIAAVKDSKPVEVHYVGKGNIHDRMLDHGKEDRSTKCMNKLMGAAVSVAHTKIDTEEERTNAEHTLYKKYGGKDCLCNDREPDGEEIKINRPYDLDSTLHL